MRTIVLTRAYLIDGDILGPGEVKVTAEQLRKLQVADRSSTTEAAAEQPKRPLVRSEAAELEQKAARKAPKGEEG
jgi:hypothetical protein